MHCARICTYIDRFNHSKHLNGLFFEEIAKPYVRTIDFRIQVKSGQNKFYPIKKGRSGKNVDAHITLFNYINKFTLTETHRCSTNSNGIAELQR